MDRSRAQRRMIGIDVRPIQFVGFSVGGADIGKTLPVLAAMFARIIVPGPSNFSPQISLTPRRFSYRAANISHAALLNHENKVSRLTIQSLRQDRKPKCTGLSRRA